MPVGEVHATQQQLGVFDMLGELFLFLCSQQPRDRRKIVFLVEIKQDLAELRVPDDYLVGIVSRRSDSRRHAGAQQAKPAKNETTGGQ